MGLRAQDGEHGERDHHQVVAAEHGPGREEHDDPRDEREVRVPRLGQHDLPVAPEDEGEQRSHDRHAPPAGASPADPEPRHDGGQVHDDRADLERPRRLPQQTVGRGQQVEAERSGVAALVRVGADPPGQADQRRVAREHVPDPELGHGQVEHRVPVIARQRDDRDQQREPDDERRDRGAPHPPDPIERGPSGPAAPPAGRSREGERIPGDLVPLGTATRLSTPWTSPSRLRRQRRRRRPMPPSTTTPPPSCWAGGVASAAGRPGRPAPGPASRSCSCSSPSRSAVSTASRAGRWKRASCSTSPSCSATARCPTSTSSTSTARGRSRR